MTAFPAVSSSTPRCALPRTGLSSRSTAPTLATSSTTTALTATPSQRSICCGPTSRRTSRRAGQGRMEERPRCLCARDPGQHLAGRAGFALCVTVHLGRRPDRAPVRCRGTDRGFADIVRTDAREARANAGLDDEWDSPARRAAFTVSLRAVAGLEGVDAQIRLDRARAQPAPAAVRPLTTTPQRAGHTVPGRP